MIARDIDEEILKLPLDRRGFLRRECAACHRQFKVRWGERDALLVQRRMNKLLQHFNEQELSRVFVGRLCPYCGYRADADDWWTEEQRQLLSRRAATLSEEIRFEQMRHVERTLSQNPYPTFVALPPLAQSHPARPEPDDMRVVPLLCCGEDVKVRDTWSGQLKCPFCGIEHDLTN